MIPQTQNLVENKRYDIFAYSSFEEAIKVATFVANSDFCPTAFKGKPNNVLLAIHYGHELKIHPLQALQNIAVINGKPSIYGDLSLAIVKTHPQYEYVKEFFEGEDDDFGAHCIVKRKNEPEIHVVFTIADAKKALLWDRREYVKKWNKQKNAYDTIVNPAPWYRYPKRMLQMRARGFALRDAFPDALKGLICAEEAMDYPKEEKYMGSIVRENDNQDLPEKDIPNDEKPLNSPTENTAKFPDEKTNSKQANADFDSTIEIDDGLIETHKSHLTLIGASQSIAELKKTYDAAAIVFDKIPALFSELNNATNKRKKYLESQIEKMHGEVVSKINNQKQPEYLGENLDIDIPDDDSYEYNTIPPEFLEKKGDHSEN